MKKEKNIEQIEIERFNPSIEEGLNDEQINLRKQQKKTNKVKKQAGKSFLGIIVNNFFTFFNLVYVILFILLKSAELSEPTIVFPISNYTFLITVIINLLIGTIQEIKAKFTMNKLQLITAPKVNVVRNGENISINSEDLVLDDIVTLKAGKQIVTDCVLVDGELLVNESQITGESDSIKKNPGDSLYSGSYVVSGNGYCKVEAVGEDSKIEQLSKSAKKYNKPKSEIMISLKKLIYFVSFFLFIFGIIMVLENYDFRVFEEAPVGSFKRGVYDNFYLAIHKFPLFSGANQSWYDTITSTCTALIGMIPSGLLMMTSATLVLGVIRLAKHNTLVQDIYCVEMLARVDVLCLDKTGTITDGSMNVIDVIDYTKEQVNYNQILAVMNEALNETNATGTALTKHFGKSTELNVTQVLPFTSDNKYSACVIDDTTYYLGAPEFILKKRYNTYAPTIEKYTSRGYRVLCLAYKEGNALETKSNTSPKLICLIIIEDHIREDAEETIRYFRENGVEVKVISGDNPITVSNVAQRVGVASANNYISLDGLTDEEVEAAATEYTVFGRVKPQQKEIIIRTLKKAGRTVAMTGDGINDILAMKQADCSVAMASGNDAIRSVAQLVLLDSSFSSMPKVVDEGRCAINNVQKIATLFLVKTVFVLILAFLTVIGFFKVTSGNASFPFSNPSQLLLLELFVIGVPATVLTIQPNKDRFSGNFLWNVLQKSLPGSLSIVISVVLTYLLTRSAGFEIHLTKTIVVLTTTFIGFMILFIACKPFNTIKAAMFALVLTISLTLTTIGMNKEINIQIFKFNVSEKIYTALELDNIFEYDVVKVTQDNVQSFNLLKETVESSNNTLRPSDAKRQSLIQMGQIILTDLSNSTMYHLDTIEYYLNESSSYLTDSPELYDNVMTCLRFVRKARTNSKNNLTPAFLTISLILLSYALMNIFAHMIHFFTNLKFVRTINKQKALRTTNKRVQL